MRFVFILAFIFLGDFLTWWLARRWIRKRGDSPLWRWGINLFMVVMLGYMFAMFVLVGINGRGGRNLMGFVPTGIVAVVYVWHLVVLPLTMLAWLIGGIGRGVRALIRRLAHRPARPAAVAPPPAGQGISRRQFLAGVAAIPPILAIGTSTWGLIDSRRFRIRRLTLPIASLPRALDGFTIAQVSDLHVGQWTTDAFLGEVVSATNSLDADLTLMTGDLIDFAMAELPRGIDTMRGLHGRHGVYLCEGNHDLFEDPSGFEHRIREAGLNILIGQATVFEHRGQAVQLLGVPWVYDPVGQRISIEQIDRLRRPGAFPILMAHHPHCFDPAAQAGFPLTLSGHTHGGQLNLTSQFGAGNILFRYISGVYRKPGATLVVSNGTGNWMPLRINAPAEILHLTLRSV